MKNLIKVSDTAVFSETVSTMEQITQDLFSDIQRQLESKIHYCLYGHGFDTKVDDFKRLLLVTKQHFDEMNELWLDGVLVLQWSSFEFESHPNILGNNTMLKGSFKYLEL